MQVDEIYSCRVLNYEHLFTTKVFCVHLFQSFVDMSDVS